MSDDPEPVSDEPASYDERVTFFDNRRDAVLFSSSFLDLQNRQPLLCDRGDLREIEGHEVSRNLTDNVKYDSQWAKLIVRYGMKEVADLTRFFGYSIAPGVSKGMEFAAGLDVRSRSAPGQILEGAARVAVSASGMATSAYIKASLGAELTLEGSMIGFALAGPPGAFVGGIIGASVPTLGGMAVSSAGGYGISKAVEIVPKASDAVLGAIGSLENAIYRLYGVSRY